MHTRECTCVLVMFSSENEIVDSLRFAFKVFGSSVIKWLVARLVCMQATCCV